MTVARACLDETERRRGAAHAQGRAVHNGGRHRGGTRPRSRGDRGDHQLHEHVQPLGDDRRGHPRAQRRRRAGCAPPHGSRRRWRPARRWSPSISTAPVCTEPLEQLGFNLVGYGCTTCIGNSGPLSPEISPRVGDADLAVVSVLSGNRNFEGRINPDVKMNYLASPPLCVAYALAGTMDIDILERAARQRRAGHGRLSEGHLAVRAGDRPDDRAGRPQPTCSARATPRCSRRRALERPGGARRRALRLGARARPTCACRPTSRTCPRRPRPSQDVPGARRAGAAGRQRHHRPHLPGGLDQARRPGGRVPAGAGRGAEGLQLLRFAPRQPRGDGARHVRQHPPAQPARGAGSAPRAASPVTCRPGRPKGGRSGRADVDLRRGDALHAGRRPARRARRQGVRLGLLARLGGQGHEAARRARRDRPRASSASIART